MQVSLTHRERGRACMLGHKQGTLWGVIMHRPAPVHEHLMYRVVYYGAAVIEFLPRPHLHPGTYSHVHKLLLVCLIPSVGLEQYTKASLSISPSPSSSSEYKASKRKPDHSPSMSKHGFPSFHQSLIATKPKGLQSTALGVISVH